MGLYDSLFNQGSVSSSGQWTPGSGSNNTYTGPVTTPTTSSAVAANAGGSSNPGTQSGYSQLKSPVAPSQPYSSGQVLTIPGASQTSPSAAPVAPAANPSRPSSFQNVPPPTGTITELTPNAGSGSIYEVAGSGQQTPLQQPKPPVAKPQKPAPVLAGGTTPFLSTLFPARSNGDSLSGFAGGQPAPASSAARPTAAPAPSSAQQAQWGMAPIPAMPNATAGAPEVLRSGRPLVTVPNPESSLIPQGPWGVENVIQSALTGTPAQVQAELDKLVGRVMEDTWDVSHVERELNAYMNEVATNEKGTARGLQRAMSNPQLAAIVPPPVKAAMEEAFKSLGPEPMTEVPMPALRPAAPAPKKVATDSVSGLAGGRALPSDTIKLDDLKNVIASGEGDYNSYNQGRAGDAGGAKIDFEQMTLGEVMNRQSLPKGDSERLFAVGKYQIIPSTMREAVTALGLNPNIRFTPQLQEKIASEYLLGTKRPEVHDYLHGDGSLDEAAEALAKEFASIEYEPTGRSFYAGSGGNAALTSAEAVKAMLEQEKNNLLAYNE